MSDIKLGNLIDGSGATRDAIHMAIIPAQAYVELRPGQRVDLDHYCKATAASGDGHGIVDPYLKENVKEGDQFWVIMNPGSVTKLRHSWQHPNLPDEDNYGYYDECRGCH
jgi:hypothetical protein